jgi:HEAT repeat protein
LTILALVSLAAAAPRPADQGTAARTAEPERAQERLASDVKLLRRAGVASDGPGLVDFFRKQTLGDEQRRTIGQLIVQLGDDRFTVRERATRELKALGPAAVPALQHALNDADPEVVARAKRCLDALKNIPSGELLAAAVRVLAARKPQRGVETLLAYLPENAHPEIEEEIVRALLVLGASGGEVDPALVRSLKHPRSVCRAIGAEVLASVGNASHRAAARKLLNDPERAVRLHVAMSLVYARDKEAVPALIDLVADAPPEQASQAEDLLCQLAGTKAPPKKPRSGATGREQNRVAWKAWWKEHGAAVNFAQLDAGPPRKAKVSARASATEVWVSDGPIGEDRAKAELVHTFDGPTRQLQELDCDFPKGLSARYVQIRTTQSPSWVAWVSIELRVGRSRPSFVTARAK